MPLGLFRSRPEKGSQALSRIKQWVREALALSDDVALTASEIVCADPSCPGTETIVLVMQPGERTRALKIPKAAEAATREDVVAATATLES